MINSYICNETPTPKAQRALHKRKWENIRAKGPENVLLVLNTTPVGIPTPVQEIFKVLPSDKELKAIKGFGRRLLWG